MNLVNRFPLLFFDKNGVPTQKRVPKGNNNYTNLDNFMREYSLFLEKFKEYNLEFYDIKTSLKLGNHITKNSIEPEKLFCICEKQKPFNTTHNSINEFCSTKCSNSNIKKNKIKDKKNIIIDFNKVHNNKYDYSNMCYTGYLNKIKVNCPIHKSFKILVKDHENGEGCFRCSPKGSKGELRIFRYLEKLDILFEKEYRFPKLIKQQFDFYIEELNLCIEFDGEGHYKPIDFNKIGKKKAEEYFKKIQYRDITKNIFCKNNNIHLLRIPYYKSKYIENIIKNKIKEIEYEKSLSI